MFMSETEVSRYIQKVTGKVHLRTGHEGSEGEYRYSSTLFYSFFNLGARWGGGVGEGVNVTPLRFTAWKETRYSLHRRPAEPQGRSGRLRKIPSPPGFDPGRPARSESLYRLSYRGLPS